MLSQINLMKLLKASHSPDCVWFIQRKISCFSFLVARDKSQAFSMRGLDSQPRQYSEVRRRPSILFWISAETCTSKFVRSQGKGNFINSNCWWIANNLNKTFRKEYNFLFSKSPYSSRNVSAKVTLSFRIRFGVFLE